MSDWDGGSDSPYGYWEGDTWIRTDAPTSTPVSSAPAWVPPPPPPPPPPAPEPVYTPPPAPEPVWTPPPEPAPAPVYAPPPAPAAPLTPARNDLIWQQVSDVYQQELGRTPDTSGWQSYYDAVSKGNLSLDDMRSELRGSAEYALLHPSAPVVQPPLTPVSQPQTDTPTPYGHWEGGGEGGATWIAEQMPTAPLPSAPLDMSQVASTAAPNYEGTPTEYYNARGDLIGYLGRDNVPISTAGVTYIDPTTGQQTEASRNAAIQLADTQGKLLYLDINNLDQNGNPSFTTTNTGIPATGSQIVSLMKLNEPQNQALFADPLFRNFLLSAAAMGGAAVGGLGSVAGAGEAAGAAGAAETAGAVGAGTTAAETASTGAGLGSLTEGITPAWVTAYEGALPSAVPSWVTSAAQSAGINAAVTAAQGGSPQDILKAAGVGALGTGLGGALSGYLNAGTIGDIVAKSAASAATAAATGGNPAAAALNVGMASALSSVIPSVTSTALSGLPESVQKAINTSVSSSIIAAIRGGDVSTAALMGAASSALSSLGSTIANSAPVQEFKSQLKDAFNNITSSVSESLTPTNTTGGALTSAAENPYSAENILAALESGYLNAPQYTWGGGQQFAGLGVTAATPEQIAELARYGITLPQVGGETNTYPTQEDVSNITIPEAEPTNQDLPMVDLTQSNVPHFTEGYPDLPAPELETWSQVMDSIYGASTGSTISQQSINNIGNLVKEGVASGDISPNEASSAGPKIIGNSNLLNVTPDVAITSGLIGYDGTFTPSGLEKALKEAGFSDDEIKNITGAGTETDTASTEASTTAGSGTGENEGEGTGAGTAGGTGLGLTVGDGTGTGLGTGTSAGTGTGAGTGTTGLSTGYSYPSGALLIGNAPSGGALPGSLQATYLKGADVKDYNPFENYNVYQQLAPINAAEGGSPLKLAQMQQSVSGIDPRLFSVLQQRQAPSYFTYGSEPQNPTQFAGSQLQGRPSPQIPLVSNVDKNMQYLYKQSGASGSGQLGTPAVLGETMMKHGGNVHMNEHGEPHIPEFITGATGHYVKGKGDGQSDDIPAMLADGEYVFDAETVAQLGNGSSDAGAAMLDKMRQEIRAHKRSAPVDEIPPPSKSPLEYLKDGLKGKRK